MKIEELYFQKRDNVIAWHTLNSMILFSKTYEKLHLTMYKPQNHKISLLGRFRHSEHIICYRSFSHFF